MPDDNQPDDLDITNRPRDSRIQFGNIQRASEQETPAGTDEGDTPYDVAAPGTPEHRIITKGERERPGSGSGTTADVDEIANDEDADDLNVGGTIEE